jgi:valyl-tRNA synthetase
MSREIAKTYEPREIEARWARAWLDEQLFRADPAAPGEPFCIVIPPPNVTGSLHIGHMLDHTLIDALTRWRRMRGFNTLYLPGTDHAGISTQRVVVKLLAEQGVNYRDLGREGFEQRVWQWKEEAGNTIVRQMEKLGESCDWSRFRFTLDRPLYAAVMEVFVRLYEEGLIYRGHYMVNWCPHCRTAISDLETVHEERAGHLWHVRYPVAGTSQHIVVATTRPETILGDTAVAVHPEDERYSNLVGQKVLLPLMNREIPIIADGYVDREFGTGALKITPAHDPNDFEIGRRHSLPEVDVLTDDAHLSAAAGPYAGLERFAARKKVVADLQAAGLLEKTQDYQVKLGTCDRCKTVIEPRAMTQWFVRMKPLAEPALAAVADGRIRITPDNWREVYFHWMRNIRDWCISRQLWWGHRIPAWHCGDCREITVARSAPAKCSKCGSARLTQDPDVLDTWFSSALWPFSTLGWPAETPDLRRYYPTSLLITGYDILFFWVARMIVMGLHFTKQVPFRHVYLHSLVRNAEGQKMSKSKGTGIDPITLNEQYGTDAMRFTLALMSAPGSDLVLSDDKIESSRNFANKIWNAARFLFFNLEKAEGAGWKFEELAAPESRAAAPHKLANSEWPLEDRWIFSRLNAATREVNDALTGYRFHEASHVVYHFFWGEFCDWYIEWIKLRLADPNREAARAAWRNLFAVFEVALRLLHPFMPFLTEELWHKLPQHAGARSIAFEPFPSPREELADARAEQDMAVLQEIIVAARNIRAEAKIDAKKKVAAELSSADEGLRELVERNQDAVRRLAALAELRFAGGALDAAGGAVRSTARFDLRIPFSEAIDVRAEIAKLRKEKDRLALDIQFKRAKLADDSFRSKAPEKIVRGMEAALRERETEHAKLAERMAQLEESSDGAGAAAP